MSSSLKTAFAEVTQVATVTYKDGKVRTVRSAAKAKGSGKTDKEAASVAAMKATHASIERLWPRIYVTDSSPKVEIKTTTKIEEGLLQVTP